MMYRFYDWLSDQLFLLSHYFQMKAVGKEARDAYQKALREPTHANLDKALACLSLASRRVQHLGPASSFIGVATAQMTRNKLHVANREAAIEAKERGE